MSKNEKFQTLLSRSYCGLSLLCIACFLGPVLVLFLRHKATMATLESIRQQKEKMIDRTHIRMST